MYISKKKSWFKHFDFMMIDLAVIIVSFSFIFVLRNSYTVLFELIFRLSVFFLVMIALVIVFLAEPYKGILKRGYWREFIAVCQFFTCINVIFIIVLFFMKMAGEFSRIVFFSAYFMEIFVSYLLRCWRKKVLSMRKYDNKKNRSVFVITTEKRAENCLRNILSKDYEDIFVCGVCIVDQDRKGQSIEGCEIVADREDVLSYIRTQWIDEIIIHVPEDDPEVKSIIEGCLETEITVHFTLTEYFQQDISQRVVDQIGNYVVLTYSKTLSKSRDVVLKRMLDIAGGIVGCLITLILMIPVGICIYIASPGPIFFSQKRVGKNGKIFKMYKFRSMYMDAEERKQELMEQNMRNDDLMFKMENDPRVIHKKDGSPGIGDFIRRTSIDEFPQFFNVLKGDMSLVGTRPPTLDEWENYELHHRARLNIKPGITGFWQISGRSDIKDFEEVVKMDLEYIENWSIGVDIKVIARTALAVLLQKGSF